MDTQDKPSKSPLVFVFNTAKVTVPEQPAGVKEANQKIAEENAQRTDVWNYPEGNKTEVLDNEGHRNTLNHY